MSYVIKRMETARPFYFAGALAGENEALSIRSPRFSPDGTKLIYLQCEATGPHCRCLQLQMVKIDSVLLG